MGKKKHKKNYIVACLIFFGGMSVMLGNLLKSTVNYAPVVGWLLGFLLFITATFIFFLDLNFLRG